MTTPPPNPDDTEHRDPLTSVDPPADRPEADNPDDTELTDVPASLYPSDETDEG